MIGRMGVARTQPKIGNKLYIGNEGDNGVVRIPSRLVLVISLLRTFLFAVSS